MTGTVSYGTPYRGRRKKNIRATPIEWDCVTFLGVFRTEFPTSTRVIFIWNPTPPPLPPPSPTDRTAIFVLKILRNKQRQILFTADSKVRRNHTWAEVWFWKWKNNFMSVNERHHGHSWPFMSSKWSLIHQAKQLKFLLRNSTVGMSTSVTKKRWRNKVLKQVKFVCIFPKIRDCAPGKTVVCPIISQGLIRELPTPMSGQIWDDTNHGAQYRL